MIRRGERVDVTTQETVKFFPLNPPRKHEIVLVDGRRCRVTRAKVKWDGDRWTLLDLRVKPVPADRNTT